ncbi:hypothetical protein MNB_SV-4-929 [hydrothermal vent metagenome]|uniref:Endonuclease/exonuclease/phosphatase domain-containing protein n=1 Tax=hydrothermal vent metagenome TaxID=652676 RepID=A0A1W1E9I3_9ZZZZ
MKLLWFVLIPLFLFAQPFKVASYNVENLFDAIYDGTEYDEFIPGRDNWNRRMAEKKLNHTAEVLCDLNADIVGLQEIENRHVFEQLRARLKRVGCGYRYGEITHKRGAPIQVALLSRFPIRSVRQIQVSYSPQVRNILEADVRVHGQDLKVFVNHWKSKSRKGYESKRIAYAKALKQRIDTLPSNKAYIVLGDLNTDYDAYLTLPKRLNDTGGRIGLNHLLKTVENGELITPETIRPLQQMHVDLWTQLPFSKRWSHKFYGRKSTLDHIVLPASMFDGKGIDYVNGSFGVFKRDYLFTQKGYINSWQIKSGKHTGRGYSDHLPIYALFDTKPFIHAEKYQPSKPVSGTIKMLYQKEKLDVPVDLKHAVVVLKRGRYAVIKQHPNGRGIFVFGVARGLEEGSLYTLRVQEIHTYKGLKEITAMVRLKEEGKVELSPYYGSLKKVQQNEVIHDITGIYKRGYLYTGGRKIPLYFKNRALRVPNGAKLKIAYAHIGYYKRLQLVLYSRKDFTVLE